MNRSGLDKRVCILLHCYWSYLSSLIALTSPEFPALIGYGDAANSRTADKPAVFAGSIVRKGDDVHA